MNWKQRKQKTARTHMLKKQRNLGRYKSGGGGKLASPEQTGPALTLMGNPLTGSLASLFGIKPFNLAPRQSFPLR